MVNLSRRATSTLVKEIEQCKSILNYRLKDEKGLIKLIGNLVELEKELDKRPKRIICNNGLTS